MDQIHFNYLDRKYEEVKYVKHFSSCSQLLAMMFSPLSNHERLRDLILALEANRSKCYHLDMCGNPIAKTTFAKDKQNRDYRIFEEFVFYMMDLDRKNRIVVIFKLKGRVYAFDSTTTPL